MTGCAAPGSGRDRRPATTTEDEPMIPVNATMVRLQALGEHTRLVVAGTFIGHDTAAACEA